MVHYYLQSHPFTSAKKIVSQGNLSLPTVNKAIRHLIDLGIVKETTGKERMKIYVYYRYIEILNEDAS